MPGCSPVGAAATQGLTLMVWRSSHQTTAPMMAARKTRVAVMLQPPRLPASSSEGAFCGMKSRSAPGTP